MSTRYVWRLNNIIASSHVVLEDGDNFEFTVSGATSSYMGRIGTSAARIGNTLQYEILNPQAFAQNTWYSTKDLNAFAPVAGSNNASDIYIGLPWTYNSQHVYIYAYPVYSVTGGIRYTLGAYKSQNLNDPLKASDLSGSKVFTKYYIKAFAGTTVKGYVSADDSQKYPSNNYSGDTWYYLAGSDSIDPSKISVQGNLRPRETITLSVTPGAGKKYEGTVSYQYQYSINNGSTWTDIGTTTAVSVTFVVPASAKTIRFRVRAKDDMGFTSADYVSTASFEVERLHLWVGVGGKARKGTELYVGVNGKARKVAAAYVGVNGKAGRFL